jgi:hypothetical protein
LISKSLCKAKRAHVNRRARIETDVQLLAILHDRITDNIETWTGEEEADYRENSVTLSDGKVAWRVFEFDGWGNVLGG